MTKYNGVNLYAYTGFDGSIDPANAYWESIELAVIDALNYDGEHWKIDKLEDSDLFCLFKSSVKGNNHVSEDSWQEMGCYGSTEREVAENALSKFPNLGVSSLKNHIMFLEDELKQLQEEQD